MVSLMTGVCRFAALCVCHGAFAHKQGLCLSASAATGSASIMLCTKSYAACYVIVTTWCQSIVDQDRSCGFAADTMTRPQGVARPLVVDHTHQHTMDSSVGHAVCAASTCCQWATLQCVAQKVNSKLPAAEQLSGQGLSAFLAQVDDAQLNEAGVWVRCFTKNQPPIIVTNPACARAMKAQVSSTKPACACEGGSQADAGSRFSHSSDYDAGRHAQARSAHRRSCPLWTPPAAGHLHSWRRDY